MAERTLPEQVITAGPGFLDSLALRLLALFPSDAAPSEAQIKRARYMVIGGAAVLGVGAFLLFKHRGRRG